MIEACLAPLSLQQVNEGSAKVSKGEILVHFNEVFDALSKVRFYAHLSLLSDV
jgi:hypothetical protein